MFVRVKKRTPSRSVVQIVASKRVGDKIQQKVLRHVGTARNAKELEALKRLGDTIKAELFRQEKKGAVLFPPEMLQKTFTDARIHREKQRKIPIEDLRAVEETKRVTTGFHDVYGKVYPDFDIIPHFCSFSLSIFPEKSSLWFLRPFVVPPLFL